MYSPEPGPTCPKRSMRRGSRVVQQAAEDQSIVKFDLARYTTLSDRRRVTNGVNT
jgi:hypothetical protein